MQRGAVSFPCAEDGASSLAPLPGGGLLIFGESTVCHFDYSTHVSYVFDELKLIQGIARIDISGDRWLFGDQHGELSILGVDRREGSRAGRLDVQKIGTTSASSCLAYLSDGHVFVGSVFGDSQLIRLRQPSGKEDSDLNDSDLVVELENYPNLGPISDLAVVGLQEATDGDDEDGDNAQGQGQIITCSGAFQDGSIRVVRSGIGIPPELEVALPGDGVKSMWALKNPRKLDTGADPSQAMMDDYLVCGQAGESAIILALEPGMEDLGDGESQEAQFGATEIGGFDEDSRLLSCVTARVGPESDAAGVLVEVTQLQVVVCNEIARIQEWAPADGGRIQAAFANSAGQVLVACGNTLHYLQVGDKATGFAVSEIATASFSEEIACVDCTALVAEDDVFSAASICAVGLWTDKTVRLLSLDNIVDHAMQELCAVELGEELHARSVLLQSFFARAHGEPKKIDSVFVGMGDGHLLAYEIEDVVVDQKAAKKLVNRRKVSLGTQPLTLVSFLTQTPGTDTSQSADSSAGMKRFLFVCGDRPTVIHADANGRLLFSNVNTRSIQSVCGFNTLEYGSLVALAQENVDEELDDEELGEDEGVGSLVSLGRIDGIQKLHKSVGVQLHEGARRLTHDPSTNTYCVTTVHVETRSAETASGSVDPAVMYVEEATVSNVLTIDCSTFEIMTKTTLEDFELGCAATTLALTAETPDGKTQFKKRIFAVGSAVEDEDEPEPSKGRILFFDPARARAVRQASGEGAETSMLEPLCKIDTDGAVYSIAQLESHPNMFVCAINSRVRVYEVSSVDESLDGLAVRQVCEHYGALVCLSVKAHGDYIVVADMMRSISLLRFSRGEMEEAPPFLEEIGRDFYPNWMTAVAVLDNETFLGAENNCNLFVVHRNTGASTDEDLGRLDTVGRFHLGEFVNVFARGSLVMPSASESSTDGNMEDLGGKADELDPDTAIQSEWAVAPIERNSTVVWGAVSGAVGLVCRLTPPGFSFLQKVEVAMRDVVQSYGELKHDEYRGFHTDKLSAPAVGFVDGDLVEKYLLLPPSEQDRVARNLKIDPELLSRRIDTLQRALH